jgi:hypothetical protein
MRLEYQLIILSSVVAVATARRGADPALTKHEIMPKISRGILDPWGYPYGWGLDDVLPNEPLVSVARPKIDKIKHVEQVGGGTYILPAT